MVRTKPELEGYLCSPETIPAEIIESHTGDNWEKTATKILNACCKLKGAYWFA